MKCLYIFVLLAVISQGMTYIFLFTAVIILTFNFNCLKQNINRFKTRVFLQCCSGMYLVPFVDLLFLILLLEPNAKLVFTTSAEYR